MSKEQEICPFCGGSKEAATFGRSTTARLACGVGVLVVAMSGITICSVNPEVPWYVWAINGFWVFWGITRILFNWW